MKEIHIPQEDLNHLKQNGMVSPKEINGRSLIKFNTLYGIKVGADYLVNNEVVVNCTQDMPITLQK